MKSFCLLTSAILILITASAFSQKTKKPSMTYETFYEQFKDLEIDFSRVSKVQDFFMPRDAAILNLDSGLVYFSKPLSGRVIAAIFTGKGHIQYAPPLKIEQDQLERFCKTQSIDGTFSKMAIIFTDSTDFDITSAFPAQEMEDNIKIKELFDKFKVYNRSRELKEVSQEVANVILNNKPGLFKAYIEMDEGNPFIYEIDPTETEEIELYRFRGDILGKDLSELINKFHWSSDYQLSDSLLQNHNHNDININKYEIDCHINTDLNVICRTTTEFTALNDNTSWLNYDLAYLLRVDSVLTDKGEKLAFYKDKEGYDLWVRLSEPLSKGKDYKLVFYYQGKIFARIYNMTYFKSSSSSWYPTHGYNIGSRFDITYHVPDNYVFASVGDNVSKDKSNGFINSRWVVNFPTQNASFNLGPYEILKSGENEIPQIEVMSVTTKQNEEVLRHASLSYKFYQSMFGPIDMKKLNITEIPYSYGEAFPGLLHLSSGLFRNYNTDGLAEIVCSHEVAHQWWGITVDFYSYRDQWLSEGFAEYSSLMYMQMALKDNVKLMEVLDRYKKDIIDVRTSIFGKGVEGGPISLGWRNSSTLATRNDYDLIVYKKGAWALHMLRIMCLNLKNMNEDVFNRIMKKFYTDFKGKNATTKDFQAIAENEMHLELGWFFDEFVDGTKIPKYKYAFKTEQMETGKYVTKLKIRQENVPEDFKMLIPIQIAFKSARPIREKIFMTGAEIVVDLPAYAYIPEDVILNDLNGVLCEVDKVDWEKMN